MEIERYGTVVVPFVIKGLIAGSSKAKISVHLQSLALTMIGSVLLFIVCIFPDHRRPGQYTPDLIVLLIMFTCHVQLHADHEQSNYNQCCGTLNQQLAADLFFHIAACCSCVMLVLAAGRRK